MSKLIKDLPQGVGEAVGVDESGKAVKLSTPKTVFSGWNNAHKQQGGLARIVVPLNWHAVPPVAEYCSVDAHLITINKAGFYHIHGHILQHDDGGGSNRRVSIVVNDVLVYYDHQSSPVGWSTSQPNHSQFFNAGDTIYFDCGVSGADPYDWHMGGHYSRIFLNYLGA